MYMYVYMYMYMYMWPQTPAEIQLFENVES